MNLIGGQYKNIKPYRARNIMVKKAEAGTEPSADEKSNESQPEKNETGYINVGVFTASGALPVPDAVVSVYHTYDDGEEHVLYHLVTDESGRVPRMEVPVTYEGEAPPSEYFYSTYNLRIQAIGYYTVNILDLQVFPNTSTNYRINLIPVMQGTPPEPPAKTIVVPPPAANSSHPRHGM